MSKVSFIAFDIDPKRVALGRAAGHQVVYGDISDPELLAAAQPQQAALVLITIDHTDTALRTVALLRTLNSVRHTYWIDKMMSRCSSVIG